jgi:HNH endonuclease
MGESNSTVEYREIQGFPEYRIGTDASFWSRYTRGCHGQVRDKWHRLKGSHDNWGYPTVTLRKNGKACMKRVGVLMLETFIGPCPPGHECRHLDDIKSHNTLDNLKWGTRHENIVDAFRNGGRVSGEKHRLAKLTDAQVAEMRAMRATGTKLRIIAEKFGVKIMQASRICSGKSRVPELAGQQHN